MEFLNFVSRIFDIFSHVWFRASWIIVMAVHQTSTALLYPEFSGKAQEQDFLEPRTPATNGLSATPLLPRTTAQSWRTWAFINVLPHLTWIILALLFLCPPYLRAIPLLMYVLPTTFTFIPPLKKCLSESLQIVAQEQQMTVIDPREANPQTPSIYGFHPHNKYPANIFPLLMSSNFFKEHIVVAQSSLGKFIPSVSYIAYAFGCICDVTKKEISSILRKQTKSVGLFPGGHREMVLLRPDTLKIPVIQHSGFLKLAKTNGTTVTPTFIFGFTDSYDTLLQKLDTWLYERMSFSLPTFIPTKRVNEPTVMVVGEPIDLTSFNEHEIDGMSSTYYNALNDLFEKHKGKFEGYKGRSLKFLLPPNSGLDKRITFGKEHKDIILHKVTTALGISFVTVFFFSNVWWSWSTWKPYDFNHKCKAMLFVHILASLLWVLATSHLTIKGFTIHHRKLGYVALLCAVIMCWSTFCLQIEAIIKCETKETSILTFSSTINTYYHALCNFQVASVVIYYKFMALWAVLYSRKKKEHQKYMRIVHTLIGLSFLPRVIAAFFRFAFPFLGGDTNFSLACAVQGLYIVFRLELIGREKSQDESGIRDVFIKANLKSWLISALFIISSKSFCQSISTVQLCSISVAPVAAMALMGVYDHQQNMKQLTKSF